MDVLQRFQGAMVGLAVGDALGTTLEFSAPGSFEPITDMQGGGHFGLKPGQWTDDTSMALCLAESLIECGGFDPLDQMRRYCRWWREGHLSSTGYCFDIGNTVADALRRFHLAGDPFSGRQEAHYGGNGSLMRLAPIPLAYFTDPGMAISQAALMSKTTHGAPEPVDACRFYPMRRKSPVVQGGDIRRDQLSGSLLLFDVLANDADWCSPAGGRKVRWRP